MQQTIAFGGAKMNEDVTFQTHFGELSGRVIETIGDVVRIEAFVPAVEQTRVFRKKKSEAKGI